MTGGAITRDSPCIECGGPRNSKRWRCDECYGAERQRHQEQGVSKIRDETLRQYGGECVCCGESEFAFLVMDHIDGGGTRHRANLNAGKPNGGGGTKTYRWLKKNDWPNTFQVLCANCNTAKDRPGGCPHQKQ